MPGMIMLWYGSIETIPSGWALCNGTNGTPDLSGKFVMGTDGSHPPGATGGASAHEHTFTGDGHSHDLATGTEVSDDTPEGAHSHATTTSPATGTTQYVAHLPNYRALCYIMKLPIP